MTTTRQESCTRAHSEDPSPITLAIAVAQLVRYRGLLVEHVGLTVFGIMMVRLRTVFSMEQDHAKIQTSFCFMRNVVLASGISHTSSSNYTSLGATLRSSMI